MLEWLRCMTCWASRIPFFVCGLVRKKTTATDLFRCALKRLNCLTWILTVNFLLSIFFDRKRPTTRRKTNGYMQLNGTRKMMAFHVNGRFFLFFFCRNIRYFITNKSTIPTIKNLKLCSLQKQQQPTIFTGS